MKGLGSAVSYSDLVCSSPGLFPKSNLITSFFSGFHEVTFTESILSEPNT